VQLIRCIAFDFDGTIVRSNQIKRMRLYDATADIIGASEILDDLHNESFKGDRHDIFRELRRRLNREDRDWTSELVQLYGELCRKSLLDCCEVPGTTAALSELKNSGKSLYIVSATPQANLIPIVADRGLGKYFKAVLGRPTGKIEHLRAILQKENLPAESFVLVGDGVDDQAAAKAVGCHFIAVTDDPLEPLSGGHLEIAEMHQLNNALAEIEGSARK